MSKFFGDPLDGGPAAVAKFCAECKRAGVVKKENARGPWFCPSCAPKLAREAFNAARIVLAAEDLVESLLAADPDDPASHFTDAVRVLSNALGERAVQIRKWESELNADEDGETQTEENKQ